MSSASASQAVGVKRRMRVAELDEETRVLWTLLRQYIEAVEIYLDIDLQRDIECIRNRTLNEGFGFLAKTLPRFLKWVRQSQEEGRYQLCPGFKTVKAKKWKKAYPSFLGNLVQFLSDDAGFVIYESDPVRRERQQFAYRAISTICQTFGAKYEIPLPKEVIEAQVRETFRFDAEETFSYDDLLVFLESEHAPILDYVRDTIRQVFEPYNHIGVFEDDEGSVMWGEHGHQFEPLDAVPRHGTGAVSYPCEPHEKYTNFMGFPPHFKSLGEYEDMLYLPGEATVDSATASYGRKERYDLAIGGVGRLEFVPKNAEKARGINLEMKEHMFPQQIFRDTLYAWLESHPLTKGHVNFHDQTVNQRLALEASRTGKYATVDITEASNSVTRVHVDNTFDDVEILGLLNSLRSRFTRATIMHNAPGGEGSVREVLFAENRKYAPMGSALCFPVEALFFWAVARSTIQFACDRDSLRDKMDVNRVWVYGDDLIFTVGYRDLISQVFGELKVKINEAKSFSKGLFRESCGVDAYDGMDVTPICRLSTRLPFRHLHNTDSDHARSLVAWIEYANMFEADGFPAVAKTIRRTVCTQYPSAKSIPRLTTEYSSGGLFWLDYDGWSVDEYLATMRDERDKRRYFVSSKSALDPSFDPEVDGVPPSVISFPYYQGKFRRTWFQSSNRYRADISENLRRLRYYSEGSEGPEAGYWFSDKRGFCLRRKTSLFS
jgi:hypothetical protein